MDVMSKFIPWASPKLFGLEKKLIQKAIQSNWISGGIYIDKFEKKLSKYLNIKYSYLTSNGTSAIHLAFLACNLKYGDEIIVPGFGYLAAANIGNLMGLNVKFVDVDRDTFCMNVETLRQQITKKTKAVVTINTYGNLHNLKELSIFLKKRKIVFIEDAAESFGSNINKKQSGTFGDIGTFSFHATKNITSGEGGLIVTKNKRFADKIQLYRSHGVTKKRYYHHVSGHNFRITNFQAAMGYAQLTKINHIIKERKKLYQKYLSELIKLDIDISIQKIENKCNFVPWTFALRINKNFRHSRDQVISRLLKKNIETRNGFYSPNYLKIFKKSRNIMNSNQLSKEIICLPIHLNMKLEDVTRIVEQLKKSLK